MSPADRFWSKVDRSGECWTWTAAKNAKGYGRFRFNGRNQPAQRVAWILKNGPWPEGALALHRCDNPSCVNPKHIFPGDESANARDSVSKGRWARNLDRGYCSKGHDLSVYGIAPNGKDRRCRKCRQEQDAGRDWTRAGQGRKVLAK